MTLSESQAQWAGTVQPTAPGASPHGPRPRRRYSRYDTWSAWVLMTPALVLFTIFILIPTIAALVLSLFEWHFFNIPSFVGLENFTRMFADPITWQSLLVTFEFVLLGVVPTIV